METFSDWVWVAGNNKGPLTDELGHSRKSSRYTVYKYIVKV